MTASGGAGRFTDTARRQGADAAALLARGAAYALSGLATVVPEALARPTPCAEWDLRALLWHLDDSVAALTEALTGGVVLDEPDRQAAQREAAERSVPDREAGVREAGERAAGERQAAVREAGDPVVAVRAGITRLVEPRGDVAVVTVGDRVLAHADLAVAGAMELAVHGWDVGRATGARPPIPAGLALRLLRYAPRLVPADVRGTLFARPVPAPDATHPGDLLVAYLGRDPAA
ncbi:maleylpyruvate isomerase family mycothiol-dependent enzyme [Actinomadura gamaensis]|uniref:Maleylpyruvate isomerase family mycothiol-dependent enzyme n=1 Tax=Actinomadura gamaensis TaxID=1763541 RepID=A0ABV9UBX9_9ACTN